MKKRRLVLHWTDRWVAAVEGPAGGDSAAPDKAIWFELPEGSEPGAVVAERLREAGIASKAAHVVLPSDQGVLRAFRLPAGSPEERLQMVKLQLEKDLPFAVEKARLAFVPAGQSVRVGAVRAEVFERSVELAASAGLTLAGMTLSPLGATASVSPLESGWMRAILVAEGRRLGLWFDEPGGDLAVRSIPYGEHHLEEGVVPWPEAFAREFVRTRNAFRTRHPEAERLAILVVAPEAEVEGLLDAGRRTGADRVEVFPAPAGASAVHAVAIGVHLAASADEPAGLDFVSSGVRRSRFRLPKGRGRVAILAGAALAVLAVPAVVRRHYEDRLLELQAKKSENDAEKKRLKPDVTRVEQLAPWSHERIPWIDVQRDLAALVDNKKVVLTSFSGKQDGTIRISGAARAEADVLDLVGRINQVEKYRARLGGTASREKPKGASPTKDFPVEFDLTLEPASTRRTRLVEPLPGPGKAPPGEKP